MSFAIGAATYAGERLAAFFAQLTASQSASSAGASASAASSTADFATGDPATAPAQNLTGSAKPSLSGDILMTLMQMQMQGAGASSASSPSGDPVQSLFGAMDADGDGSVSETEMESYLEANGGTQGEADALYGALAGSTSAATGLSESQFAAAMPQPGAGGVHHHHHRHHAGGADPADTLMSLLDANGDGAVSQDAFTSFVTANGGSAADAASDFSALDADQSGSITTADLTKAWENIQNQQNAGPLAVSVLDAFAKANAMSASSTTSVSA